MSITQFQLASDFKEVEKNAQEEVIKAEWMNNCRNYNGLFETSFEVYSSSYDLERLVNWGILAKIFNIFFKMEMKILVFSHTQD